MSSVAGGWAIPTDAARWQRRLLLLAIAVGLASFAYYYASGLTTLHYDAKAHLVVARRMVDSSTPGYSQMGSHWLPLSHLLYLPFVLFDSQYRSALFPSLISVASFVVSALCVFRIALRVTGSPGAGLFAGILLLANPNLQFLQSAPMTEPVYMALMLLALDGLIRWRDADTAVLPWIPAVWLALAGLCRYEAWYLLGGVVLLLLWDGWSRYLPRRKALLSIAVYAGALLAPALAHFAYLYLEVGDTFFHRVARGAPAPAEAYRQPLLASYYHLGELWQILTTVCLLLGVGGTVWFLTQGTLRRRWLPLLLLWIPSLINVSALYWGMIYRVRYSILLLPAVAVFAALLTATPRRARLSLLICAVCVMVLPWLSWSFPDEWKYHMMRPGPGIVFLPIAALLLGLFALARESYRWPLLALCLLSMQVPALRGEHRAMQVEASEHGHIEPERAAVIDHLRNHYDGTRILIDMGRHAPLVYDSELAVREFVYNEGNKALWNRAIRAPEEVVGWIFLEKGDELWRLRQVDPPWSGGYALALQTESFFLFRLRETDRGALLPGGQSE